MRMAAVSRSPAGTRTAGSHTPMKTYACAHCRNKVYFENVRCLRCKHALGFDPDRREVATLKPAGEGVFVCIGDESGPPVRYCANHAHGVCNWLTRGSDGTALCVACTLNRTIPNLSEAGSLQAWRDLERAKKRLVYSLLRFGLPVDATAVGKGRLTFDFVRDATTGHMGGVITIDIMEADAVERERQRQHFDEPYRSLLGHLRHESGHFYWTVLVEAAGLLEPFRALFGDERQSYGQALERHHTQGPPADWQERHVSAYASSHPWEDWAETFAHYIHMVDALDTAEAEGMEPRAAGLKLGALWPFRSYDLYRDEGFAELMARWIPLTLALNSMSRSIGNADFYPFVIPAAAYDKLAFVHRVIREGAGRWTGKPGRRG